jgi:hypothetical protein
MVVSCVALYIAAGDPGAAQPGMAPVSTDGGGPLEPIGAACASWERWEPWTNVGAVNGEHCVSGGKCTAVPVTPPARLGATTWIGGDGSFWLYGGLGASCDKVAPYIACRTMPDGSAGDASGDDMPVYYGDNGLLRPEDESCAAEVAKRRACLLDADSAGYRRDLWKIGQVTSLPKPLTGSGRTTKETTRFVATQVPRGARHSLCISHSDSVLTDGFVAAQIQGPERSAPGHGSGPCRCSAPNGHFQPTLSTDTFN